MIDEKKIKPGQIQGKKNLWEMVIGLEIHAQVSSSSKLFSGCILFTNDMISHKKPQ